MKPKKGDTVSIKNVGFGCTSYEGNRVERVRGDKVWLEDLDSPFEFPSGRWLMDGPSLGLTTSAVFDGGKLYEKHKDD